MRELFFKILLPLTSIGFQLKLTIRFLGLVTELALNLNLIDLHITIPEAFLTESLFSSRSHMGLVLGVVVGLDPGIRPWTHAFWGA